MEPADFPPDDLEAEAGARSLTASAEGDESEVVEGGSFRDPSGFIFLDQGRVLRAIHRRSAEDWQSFSASPLFEELKRDGLLIPTRPVALESVRLPVPAADFVAVVEHERVPLVSYPYEWCFGMLKAAALLHLEILQRCLRHGFILKDASAYNVQFIGTRPVFIDVLSFSRLTPGEAWMGYNQFCRMFLYPLMLQAYKQVPFQSWLRSELEGLDPIQFSRLMSARDLLRPGVFFHVYLQAAAEKRLRTGFYGVRQSLRSAGFSPRAIAHNVRGLRRVLEGLQPKESDSNWVDYERAHSYSDEAMREKEEFVRQVLASQRPRRVWDLGSNVGRFSRAASEQADYVVALDADPAASEVFYRTAGKEGKRNILPLVMNLANLSPDQGWGGHERRSLVGRGRPDLVLCLALIHHVVISANIPLASFLRWLARLNALLVIEFVSKEDAMAQRLLLNKEDTYDQYERGYFEQCLQQYFEVQRMAPLASTRFLYYSTPRPGAVLSR